MNMVNRPRFRRKHLASPEDDLRPVPPLERPADRRARKEEQRHAALLEAEMPGDPSPGAPREEVCRHGPLSAPPAPPLDYGFGTDAVLRAWDSMQGFAAPPHLLDQNRIVATSRQDPAHDAFDVLCTSVLSAIRERNWTRIAVTSPTKGCGKTFTSVNLGIALAQQKALRSVVLDFDLCAPSLHKIFGIEAPGSLGDMLRGKVAPESHLRRLGPNGGDAGPSVAFGFNDTVEPSASHLLRDPRTARALDRLEERLEPDVVLMDLPPMLSSDEVQAIRPQFDAVLLVTGGGVTTDAEIREVERRLGTSTPLLGVVLNRAEVEH